MINLTVEEITHIHKKLIEKTGGMPGLRDFGMLESAVYSTMQSFGEEDVYPTFYERAARLAYAITMNPVFHFIFGVCKLFLQDFKVFIRKRV